MQVRMEVQVLTPAASGKGVQHGEEADGGAEVCGVGGNGEQSFGSGLKQDGVNPSRILKCQAADLLGEREYDMEVGNGQQLGLPLGEPLGAGRGLALGATAIATRVEYFDAMSAPVALIQMTTQDRAMAQIFWRLQQRFDFLAAQNQRQLPLERGNGMRSIATFRCRV
jgi:hypothetical protein